MGVHISPGDASWSYSGFNDFRRRVAQEEGFELDAMEGFGGLRDVPAGTRSWDEIASTLTPLLHHSDCDGYLDSYECEVMLPRLHEIAKKWLAPDPRFDPVLAYDAAQLVKLIDGMEHSVAFGCSVVFG